MISLRDLEHEFTEAQAMIGDLGRGKILSQEEVAALDTAGYESYRIPGTAIIDFPIYSSSGAVTDLMWRGYSRRDGDRQFFVSIEYRVSL